MKRRWHLSYPFVFAFEGRWYMVPEMSGSGRIDLFRADDFPCGWTFVKTLLQDVSAADTTLIEHAGRWWLFTSVRKLGGSLPLSHLYLFSAENPLSTSWEPHPMNPIVSGVIGARGAGGFLRRGGRLIRPSQDSLASYGRRVLLTEIVTMTGEDFEERPAGLLEPNGDRGFVGLHTVSQADDLTVVDLCRWRPRL